MSCINIYELLYLCEASNERKNRFLKSVKSYYHVLRGNWGVIFSREMQYSYGVFPNLLHEKDKLGIRETSLCYLYYNPNKCLESYVCLDTKSKPN